MAQKLELVAILLRQGAGASDVDGLADDPIVPSRVEIEGGLEAVLHEGHSQVGDVDADPVSNSSLWAAAMAVPQPQKGSSTTSPGLLLAWMMRSSKA